MFLLLVLGCSREPAGAVMHLNRWQEAGGAVVGTPIRKPAITVTHPVVIEPELADRPARLEFDASTWRATVSLDGAVLGSGTGGVSPLWVEFPDGLPAGAHTLQVQVDAVRPDNIVPGRTIPTMGAWSFHPFRGEGAVFSGAAVLRVGTAVEDVAVRGWLEDGVAEVEARGAALAGRSFTVRIVRDGAVLADLGRVTADASGVLRSNTLWTGGRWPEARAAVVLDGDDGTTWRSPFLARDIDLADRISRDGAGRYIAAVRGAWGSTGRTARTEMFDQARAAARRGAEALEVHAEVYSQADLRVLDELGMGVVVTPRCSGRSARNGAPPADPARYAQLTSEHVRMASAYAQHPSVWAWTVELDGSFAPMQALDTAFFAKNVVASVQLGVPHGSVPWFVEVMTDRVPWPFHSQLSAFIGQHRGAGIVLPALPGRVTPESLAEYEAAERTAVMAKGAVPWEPPLRRGAAIVELRGAPGTVAYVEVPLEPPVGVVIGGDGVGSVEVDASGPASVRVGATREAIALTPGEWSADGWRATPTSVNLAAR